jgi:hypothetical protein
VINIKFFKALISLSILLGFSSAAFAQSCGEAPEAPEIPDGATATMDQLVATSGAVNTFLDAADVFLDCGEAEKDTVVYKDLSRAEKGRIVEAREELIDIYNNIADDFNEEVMAYKEANP